MGANNAGIMTPATRRVVAAARAYVDAECRRVDAEAANGQPGSYRRMVAADAAARRALYRLADAVDGLEREERTTSRGRQLAADAGAMD
jgi:hypothetical protein